jgi:hypothetical protein
MNQDFLRRCRQDILTSTFKTSVVDVFVEEADDVFSVEDIVSNVVDVKRFGDVVNLVDVNVGVIRYVV